MYDPLGALDTTPAETVFWLHTVSVRVTSMTNSRVRARLVVSAFVCLVGSVGAIAIGLEARQTKPAAKPKSTQTTKRPPAAAAAAAPKVERPVPFAAGETLSYDVSWSMAFVTAGSATLRVVDKHASYGSMAYYLLGEGRPSPMLAKLYSLYYKADSLLDVYSLTSQRGSVYSDENGRKRLKSLRFNPDGRTAIFEMQTSTSMKKDIAVPALAQDALSALYAMRAMPLAPGTTIKMPVCISDAVYSLSAAVGQREDVKTGIGTLPGFKITPTVVDAAGKPIGRKMTLWLSDDAKRIPLRLQADLPVGSFNLVLREVKY